MVILHVHPKSTNAEEWEDKLLELSIAHKIEQSDQLSQPVLKHNKDEYCGEEAINNYLKELEKFVFDWRKCACEG